jgi:hypothetical protein
MVNPISMAISAIETQSWLRLAGPLQIVGNALSGKLEGVFCLGYAQLVKQGLTYRANFKHRPRCELGIPDSQIPSLWQSWN